ncbi:4'-phosphopantetheinyl transferase [Ruminiclostridium sufflavum DSM 19573]|uniref:4'-phosphopantetheinyl transferase n=1 Tax=Ruminiclostridium sufflavum DSM 19573 TaxID=1121337 RepID=A0A318XGP0_9FIRM|nr:4'-phosphopantetheinyl transferase superfamily protein [Ruminiclostridium sufflavum]PYG85690.1 4'-phosphopantetheinyl transferase [Ruminiclostridium sufflavum DSM 19573]
MLDIYIVNLDNNLEKDAFDILLRYVSEDKKAQIHRFYHFEDSQRALVGNLLSRYVICRSLNIKNTNIAFEKNEYGKPFLSGHYKAHFNISHSGSWVACAISDYPVGIDVEVMKPTDLEIARRFFSNEEYTALTNQPDEEKQAYFFKLWTLKESYIKAVGKGLSIPLDSFTVNVESNSIMTESEQSLIDYSFFHSSLDENSFYAICAKKTNSPHKKATFNARQFFYEACRIL